MRSGGGVSAPLPTNAADLSWGPPDSGLMSTWKVNLPMVVVGPHALIGAVLCFTMLQHINVHTGLNVESSLYQG